MKYTFATDEDTERLFDIVVWCLIRYFQQRESDAIQLVNQFYRSHSSTRDDDYYHHEGPFSIAVKIYYLYILQLDMKDFLEWREKEGLNYPPDDYFQYYRTHYFTS